MNSPLSAPVAPARILVTLILGTCLAGGAACAPRTAPRLVQPRPPMSATWKQPAPEHADAASARALPPDAWWTAFGDAQLDTLIDRATHANADLYVAMARVHQARALWRAARAQRGPTAGVTADAGLQRFSALDSGRADRAGDGMDGVAARFGVGGEVAYEVDLWNRRGALMAAAAADSAAAMADVGAARIAVASEVTRQYVMLAELARRQDTIAEALQFAEERRSLIVRLRAAGLLTAEASLTVERELDRLRLLRIQTDGQQTHILHALAALVGDAPAAFTMPTLAASPPLWQLRMPVVSVGLPSTVLAARPDVTAAEARLAASTYRTRAAIKASFPEFTLTGSLGLATDTLRRLARGDAAAWATSVRMSAPWLNRQRLRADIESTQADEDLAHAQYRQTILTALVEVENALAAVHRTRDQESLMQSTLASREQSEQRMERQAAAGVASRLEVLEARTLRVEAREALDHARAERFFAAIDLIRALGTRSGPPEPPSSDGTKSHPATDATPIAPAIP